MAKYMAGSQTDWWLDVTVAGFLMSEWLVYGCQMSGWLLAGRMCMVAGGWWTDVIVANCLMQSMSGE